MVRTDSQPDEMLAVFRVFKDACIRAEQERIIKGLEAMECPETLATEDGKRAFNVCRGAAVLVVRKAMSSRA